MFYFLCVYRYEQLRSFFDAENLDAEPERDDPDFWGEMEKYPVPLFLRVERISGAPTTQSNKINPSALGPEADVLELFSSPLDNTAASSLRARSTKQFAYSLKQHRHCLVSDRAPDDHTTTPTRAPVILRVSCLSLEPYDHTHLKTMASDSWCQSAVTPAAVDTGSIAASSSSTEMTSRHTHMQPIYNASADASFAEASIPAEPFESGTGAVMSLEEEDDYENNHQMDSYSQIYQSHAGEGADEGVIFVAPNKDSTMRYRIRRKYVELLRIESFAEYAEHEDEAIDYSDTLGVNKRSKKRTLLQLWKKRKAEERNQVIQKIMYDDKRLLSSSTSSLGAKGAGREDTKRKGTKRKGKQNETRASSASASAASAAEIKEEEGKDSDNEDIKDIKSELLPTFKSIPKPERDAHYPFKFLPKKLRFLMKNLKLNMESLVACEVLTRLMYAKTINTAVLYLVREQLFIAPISDITTFTIPIPFIPSEESVARTMFHQELINCDVLKLVPVQMGHYNVYHATAFRGIEVVDRKIVAASAGDNDKEEGGRKRLANSPFWLILSVEGGVVYACFYNLPIASKALVRMIRHIVERTVATLCRRVNQKALLQRLLETKHANPLLTPATAKQKHQAIESERKFAVQWDTDLNRNVNAYEDEFVRVEWPKNLDTGKHSLRDQLPPFQFQPGEFACPCVLSLAFYLHPRVLPDIGLTVVREHLERFKGDMAAKHFECHRVANFVDTYVFQQADGGIFYFTVSLLRKKAVPFSAFNSRRKSFIKANQKRYERGAWAKFSPVGSSDASVRRDLGVEEGSDIAVVLEVFGMETPSEELAVHLPETMLYKLERKTLQLISAALADTNPQLTRWDHKFIRPFLSTPEACVAYPLRYSADSAAASSSSSFASSSSASSFSASSSSSSPPSPSSRHCRRGEKRGRRKRAKNPQVRVADPYMFFVYLKQNLLRFLKPLPYPHMSSRGSSQVVGDVADDGTAPLEQAKFSFVLNRPVRSAAAAAFQPTVSTVARDRSKSKPVPSSSLVSSFPFSPPTAKQVQGTSINNGNNKNKQTSSAGVAANRLGFPQQKDPHKHQLGLAAVYCSLLDEWGNGPVDTVVSTIRNPWKCRSDDSRNFHLLNGAARVDGTGSHRYGSRGKSENEAGAHSSPLPRGVPLQVTPLFVKPVLGGVSKHHYKKGGSSENSEKLSAASSGSAKNLQLEILVDQDLMRSSSITARLASESSSPLREDAAKDQSAQLQKPEIETAAKAIPKKKMSFGSQPHYRLLVEVWALGDIDVQVLIKEVTEAVNASLNEFFLETILFSYRGPWLSEPGRLSFLTGNVGDHRGLSSNSPFYRSLHKFAKNGLFASLELMGQALVANQSTVNQFIVKCPLSPSATRQILAELKLVLADLEPSLFPFILSVSRPSESRRIVDKQELNEKEADAPAACAKLPNYFNISKHVADKMCGSSSPISPMSYFVVGGAGRNLQYLTEAYEKRLSSESEQPSAGANSFQTEGNGFPKTTSIQHKHIPLRVLRPDATPFRPRPEDEKMRSTSALLRSVDIDTNPQSILYRNSFVLIGVAKYSRELTVWAYNMAPAVVKCLSEKIAVLVDWTMHRQNLLNGILHQKLGLFTQASVAPLAPLNNGVLASLHYNHQKRLQQQQQQMQDDDDDKQNHVSEDNQELVVQMFDLLTDKITPEGFLDKKTQPKERGVNAPDSVQKEIETLLNLTSSAVISATEFDDSVDLQNPTTLPTFPSSALEVYRNTYPKWNTWSQVRSVCLFGPTSSHLPVQPHGPQKVPKMNVFYRNKWLPSQGLEEEREKAAIRSTRNGAFAANDPVQWHLRQMKAIAEQEDFLLERRYENELELEKWLLLEDFDMALRGNTALDVMAGNLPFVRQFHRQSRVIESTRAPLMFNSLSRELSVRKLVPFKSDADLPIHQAAINNVRSVGKKGIRDTKLYLRLLETFISDYVRYLNIKLEAQILATDDGNEHHERIKRKEKSEFAMKKAKAEVLGEDFVERMRSNIVLRTSNRQSSGHAHILIERNVIALNPVKVVLRKILEGFTSLIHVSFQHVFICVQLSLPNVPRLLESSRFSDGSYGSFVGGWDESKRVSNDLLEDPSVNRAVIKSLATMSSDLHLNSFTYDFHLRHFYSYVLRRRAIYPSIDFKSTLSSFTRFWPHPPPATRETSSCTGASTSPSFLVLTRLLSSM